MLQRFLKDETGATAIEYGLIVAVLSLAIVGGIGQAGNAHRVAVQRQQQQACEGLRALIATALHRAQAGQCPPGSSSIVVSETFAEPGFSGFCCEASGAQPDIQTIEKVARMRPSASENRSA